MKVGDWFETRDLDGAQCRVKVVHVNGLSGRVVVIDSHGRDTWSVWANDLYYQRGDAVLLHDGEIGHVRYVDNDGDVIVEKSNGSATMLNRTHLTKQKVNA